MSYENPVLALPSAQAALAALSDDERAALRTVLLAIGEDARNRADHCWRRNKGPMAAYWKSVGVYARHIARALR